MTLAFFASWIPYKHTSQRCDSPSTVKALNRKVNFMHAKLCLALFLIVTSPNICQTIANAQEIKRSNDVRKSNATLFEILQKQKPNPNSSKKSNSSKKTADVSQSANEPQTDTNAPDTKALEELVNAIAKEHLPHSFEDKKKWGKTKEVWRGVKIRLDGGKIETKRRKKEVNHGDWQMYKANLVDPNRELNISIENLHRNADGAIRFDLGVAAKVNAHGRSSKWVGGVQLYSLSVDATADLKLIAKCQVNTKLDFGKTPPDIVVQPKVMDAVIEMQNFRLQRVSKIGGEVAQQLGKAIRGRLEKEIDKRKEKLVKKVNQSIEKRKDKFRLSLSDFLKSHWSSFLNKSLPASSPDATSNESKKGATTETPN